MTSFGLNVADDEIKKLSVVKSVCERRRPRDTRYGEASDRAQFVCRRAHATDWRRVLAVG